MEFDDLPERISEQVNDISMAMSMEARVVNTHDLTLIIHEANSLDYNRVYPDDDIDLLDPDAIHILSPLLIHRHAQEEEVDPHMRCQAYLGLTNREDTDPYKCTLDIPMHWFTQLHTYTEARELLGLDPTAESEGDALINEIQMFIDGSKRFKPENTHV